MNVVLKIVRKVKGKLKVFKLGNYMIIFGLFCGKLFRWGKRWR